MNLSLLARVCAAALPLTLCVACAPARDDAFPGYAEGDYVRLSAPLAGTLTGVHLRRGDQVKAGAPAYVLEQASETAARQEAQSRVGRAEALLADLRKGARSDEVAALQAALREAEAALALAQANLERERKLVADKFISRARLDQSAAALAADRARVEQARARLRLAGTSARSDQVAAAEKEVEAARALLAQAQWKVDQKAQATPVAGMVSDVAYRAGEWVPAGAAIVTLLPPANIKARFFIPETQLGKIRMGQGAIIACDGCAQPVKARITFVSPEAEYTSPLIYSKENRASLVFMVEATPEPGQAPLHPGQPLTVRMEPKP
ncbi:HlyD family secretion protein [Massilia antarctica]|uniref:HlyD family secretion protein n=1 Tax=Massilia antarctica TaxID=2765360 RepID=UPI0006BC9621|nr:HlyD family efflux transporter periplasmic adaptor subunit [Massilia sp. H27-R4]MCY0914953.1 HlyD family efflux transporter periplasmic adaptor subunit [Massilia sp. H27-R4]CUI06919.1 Predicted membrane fusion protein (MFP) component of efflux pump, membrane anchor protein YbhG [Janthinobacterium sp. CG23_2]CUU30705.1 Predicted membrane fusion protein (MFP) component of efflux pump, membrane anchor protein YbhG [Janthinobacterium sp. CG23_2]